LPSFRLFTRPLTFDEHFGVVRKKGKKDMECWAYAYRGLLLRSLILGFLVLLPLPFVPPHICPLNYSLHFKI
jgi:hypothetical protein